MYSMHQKKLPDHCVETAPQLSTFALTTVLQFYNTPNIQELSIPPVIKQHTHNGFTGLAGSVHVACTSGVNCAFNAVSHLLGFECHLRKLMLW